MRFLHGRTLSFAVRGDGVHGVLVYRGKALGAVSRPAVGADEIEAVVRLIIEELRVRQRRWRPKVVAAIGPAASQVRPLARLPNVESPRARAALVRENAHEFFVGARQSLIVGGVENVGTEWWGSAFDVGVVDAVARGCRASGLRLALVAPAVVAIPFALPARSIRWRDGGHDLALDVDEHRSLRGVGRAADCDPAPDAESWADARGAALMPLSHPLALTKSDSFLAPHDVPGWRAAAAYAGVMLALGVISCAPELAAHRVEHRVFTGRAGLAATAESAVADRDGLARVTDSLNAIAAFTSDRRQLTPFLGSLTQSLSVETSLVSLRIDERGGSLVAIATRAAALLEELRAVPAIANVRILGAVTTDAVAGRRVERVAVAFDWTVPGAR